MSSGSLTRILNNQIYNQTIIASQKIQPGSIVGSLFASNVTVPGDLLIAGNLFVLGNSIQTTISSTNTYVNDPLLTLNNGFAGTNTYDEGLIFNRGSATNQAFIWSETFKEFRVIATSETGTTYGNVNASDLANLSVKNFYTSGTNNTDGNINQRGTGAFGATFAGNVGLNGPYLTTSQATISVFNTAATTVNEYGAATAIYLGATSGTVVVNNPTIVGTQTTQNVFNANATTVNAFNSATTLNLGQLASTANVGATTGTFQLNNPTVVGYNTTQNLWNTLATTVNAFGAAGNLNLGSGAGGSIATINNQAIYLPSATNIAVGGSSLTFANTVVTTVNEYGSATSVFIGATSGVVTARSALSATGTFWANSSAGSTQQNQGIGAIVVPTGGISVGGTANIAGATVIGGATQINSTLGVGGVTSITNTTNATGQSTGALQVAGGASFTQDVWIGGNLFVSNIIGVQANIITVTDPLLYLRNSNVSVYNYDIGFYSAFTGTGLGTINQYQHTAVFRNPLNNTWNFVSNLAEPSASYITIDGTTVYDPIKAGNLQLTVTTDSTSTTTGALIVGGGAGIGGNIFQSGAYHDSSSSNFINMPTPTTANNLSAATTIFYGAAAGDFTIRNPNINSVQASLNLFNANVTTLNFAGAATTISVGAATGTTTFNSATNGATYRAGAVVVGGGVGINGNLNLSRSNYITLGADWNSNVVYPENVVQIVSNANVANRISIQNLNNGTFATSEFQAIADIGSNINSYISTGISSSTNGLNIIKPLDGYTYTSAGNLVISSAIRKDLVLAANGISQVGVRISSQYSNVGVQYSTAATSSTTGALTSVGGISTKANLYVGRGVTINSDNSIETFTVKSSTSGNVAIFANVVGTAGTSTTETVIIGGSNLAVQTGVILKVNGQTSMMLPVGPQAARPSSQGGVDVAGMIRFNSTSNLLEYYDGSVWQVAGSTFTVISDRQFQGNVGGGYGNVDGTNTTFTIQSNATTSGTLVAINGVMQFPTLAYSVSGSTLTFTEPPAPGDVIDVRVLTTTATVSSIANGNGVNQLVADNTGVSFYTGTTSTVEQVLIDPAGNFNFLNQNHITYTQAPTNVPTTASPVVIDTFSQSSYSSSKYLIQAKVGVTNFESYEARVITDGAGNAYITTYGIINNGTSFGTISANVVSGNVNVYYTSTIAQANVKAFGTYIV